ncbi:52 kDa repressor of the inhibitor of the protein kinase-like [Hydra vulgaris]|uniref:52 kDa repressor of the inhibitor of the protein kinase-like n=1 Tax=Hydra vulgaris TaxID=6087 RepID=A0ABM4DBV4_HYDVU
MIITDPLSIVFLDYQAYVEEKKEYLYPDQYLVLVNYSSDAKTLSNSEVQHLVQSVFVPCKTFTFLKNSNGRSFQLAWIVKFRWLTYSKIFDGAFCLRCVLFGHSFHSDCTIVERLFSKPFNYWNDASAHFKKHISENRRLLLPIIETITLCGRLGLPLRVHRDNSKFHPGRSESPSPTAGNFIELLHFRVKAGDKILEDHLKYHQKNEFYISNTSQNEMIICCGEVVTDKIIEEIKKSQYFSIIADKASDSSNKEQLSLIIRFVDSNLDIKEEFVKFIHCSNGVTGEGLFSVLLKSMPSQTLAICASWNVQSIRNLLTHVKDVSYFFNLSPTRQQKLEEHIDKITPLASKKKLKDVCRTRWIDKVHGMDTFQELFIPVVSCLEEMSFNINKTFNHTTSTSASSLLKLITGFDLIVALCITRNALKDAVSSFRNIVDEHHQICYEQALKIASKINVIKEKPRTSFISKNRANTPFESVSHYFKLVITIPLLDHLSTELNTRFNDTTLKCYKALVLVPSKIITKVQCSSDTNWKDHTPSNHKNIFKDINKFSSSVNCNYYDVIDLNKTLLSNSERYIYLNIASLPFHIDELYSVISSPNNFPLAIGIKESNLYINDTNTTDKYINGFNIEHCSTETKKGGALLYLRSNLNYVVYNDLMICSSK